VRADRAHLLLQQVPGVGTGHRKPRQRRRVACIPERTTESRFAKEEVRAARAVRLSWRYSLHVAARPRASARVVAAPRSGGVNVSSASPDGGAPYPASTDCREANAMNDAVKSLIEELDLPPQPWLIRHQQTTARPKAVWGWDLQEANAKNDREHEEWYRRVREGKASIDDPPEGELAYAVVLIPNLRKKPAGAIARLVAAAPELLSVCADVLDSVTDEELRKRMLRALAAATGTDIGSRTKVDDRAPVTRDGRCKECSHPVGRLHDSTCRWMWDRSNRCQELWPEIADDIRGGLA